jgi:hypothetical protein
MKQLRYWLRQWFGRIRVAVWLHPEIDMGRRAAIFGGAALVAAIALTDVPMFYPRLSAEDSIMRELVEVARGKFVPRMFVHLYRSPPLLADLLA